MTKNKPKPLRRLLFWQPSTNYFQLLSGFPHGSSILLFLNYSPWLIVLWATLSLVSVRGDLIFQIILAMILSEVLEKIIKVKNLWSRPLDKKGNQLPKGFIQSWYKIGSFPSGHAIKAIFFTFLLLSIKPALFLPIILILLSLSLIRVLLSLHYPVDFLGGAIFGFLIYQATNLFSFSTLLPWTHNLPAMLTDLPLIFTWWLTIFLVSSTFLPLTFKIFGRFWDKGYLFSKVISASLLTYFLFVLSVFKTIPFSRGSIFLLLLMVIGFTLYFFNRHPQEKQLFQKTLSQKLPIFLGQELLFFLTLSFWSYIRGFAPNIEGLEKFMDWGFVNSALRSSWLPPLDMWFAGETINYYYFGHLIAAFWTKLSTLSSALTYNLLMATSFALTFSLSFSFASNLCFLALQKFSVRKINFRPIILAGLVSALLVSLGGNFHTIYKVRKISQEQDISWSDAANRYWYPDATRFIGYDPDIEDKTIHEFPIYSFVVADLHGHMNDIPHVIFFLAFLLVFLSYSSGVARRDSPDGGTKQLVKTQIFSSSDLILVVPAGLILSLMYMTNAWDFGVHGLLLAFFIFFLEIWSAQFQKDLWLKVKTIFLRTALLGLATIFAWFIFTLPFTLNFQVLGEGLKWSDSHTPFYQLFILYGGFWIISSLFLILLALRNKIKAKAYRKFIPTDLFVLIFILTGTILIILPEIGYVKDIYIYSHRRANTMFKLVYEAFILFSLVSGYILFRIKESLKSQKIARFVFTFIFFLVFSAHLVYPYFAIRGYYGNLREYRGLYGLNFLKDFHPNSYAAVNWINKNITGQPVILEATGDSYTLYNHFSVATGLPTVEGWLVHEWLWRGGYDQPGARAEEVRQVYEAQTIAQALPILQKYSVQYVIIGDLEREKYPALNESIFSLIARPVFTSADTVIYKLNP
jgi:uncharacterized membrane protein/membrane-associated phospholipid phosphatase